MGGEEILSGKGAAGNLTNADDSSKRLPKSVILGDPAKGVNMQKCHDLKGAGLFFGLTLGLSCFVLWGPLALFKIPTISFTSATIGPIWAISLFIYCPLFDL